MFSLVREVGHEEQVMDNSARDQIESWRAETAETHLQSARQVQDRLLDLYGALEDSPVITQVEAWLSLTRERELFADGEIAELLDEIESGLLIDEIESGLSRPETTVS
jgi:hypothetical protein